MKREKRDAAGRDATGKLVRHNGQDVQNLFVGTRVVVNFRVARQPLTEATYDL
jgi:threonine dehydrogenase-like Zn-dependent dehydrogenase